jgi:hypothetical protein
MKLRFTEAPTSEPVWTKGSAILIALPVPPAREFSLILSSAIIPGFLAIGFRNALIKVTGLSETR